MEFQVRNNAIYWVEDGKDLGYISWERDDDGDMHLMHTVVSEELRGQGAAMKLLTKAVEYAKENGKKVVPVCSYAVNRIEEVPGAKEILKK